MGDSAGLEVLHAWLIEEMLPAAPGGEEAREGVEQHGGPAPSELVQAQARRRPVGRAGMGAWQGERHQPQHHCAKVLRGSFDTGARDVDALLQAVQADDSLHEAGGACGLRHDP